MARRLEVSPHLTHEELKARFLRCSDAAEARRWQAVLLKSEGRSSADIAQVCKRKEDWVRRTVRGYNAEGPDALRDGREHNGRARFLADEQTLQLGEAVRARCPYGGDWTGAKVSRWVLEHLNIQLTPKAGIDYLHRLKMSRQVPRPRHQRADQEAQEAFKKGGLNQA